MNGRCTVIGVLTHGFTVDEEGPKESEVHRTLWLPQKKADEHLAPICVRLWIASTDLRKK